MGTGYNRNDSSNNIADGNVINASDLDGEFDAIVNAFKTDGHSHDGTSAEGAAIVKVGPAQQLEISASGLSPATTNTLDLGGSAKQFKDLYLDGTANLDNISADAANVIGAVTMGSTLSVVGAASVGGSLGVSGNASVDGSLSIGGTFNFATANVTGSLGISDSVSVGTTLSVISNTSVGGTFTVTGNASGAGTLDVKGAASVGGATTITGAISGASTLAVKGNASVGGTLKVTGNQENAGTLEAVGNTSVGGTLTITNTVIAKDEMGSVGNASVGGSLTVTNDYVGLDRFDNVGAASVGGSFVLTGDIDVAGGISGTSTLDIRQNASVGGTLVVTNNQANAGTLSVIGAASVGGTLGVTGNASVGGTLGVTGNASITGTLAITDEFTFATANSTGNLGVVKNASVGGTFHIEGNTSAQGTLNVKGAVSVASTLGVEGEINNETGNIIIDPTTKIVEIKGGGSTDGQIQLNCRSNSHGQKIMSQPHSEAVTNEMLLPKGANSTLLSEAGTATITNKTYLDVDGNLRAVPVSRELATQLGTAAATDTGNFILMKGTASSTQTLVLAADTFSAGDIFTVVNSPFGGKTAAAVTTFSAAQMNSCFVAGAETSTALVTLAYNGVASVLFASANGCIITGNVE